MYSCHNSVHKLCTVQWYVQCLDASVAGRYVRGKDSFKRLQTVRLDDENLYTPELNTFTASSPSSPRENIFRSLDPQDCQLSESGAGGSSEEEEEEEEEVESRYHRLRSVSLGTSFGATAGGLLGRGSNKCPPSAPPLSAPSTSGLLHLASSGRSEGDGDSNRCPSPAPPLSAASTLLHLAIGGNGVGQSSNRCPPSAPPLFTASNIGSLLQNLAPNSDGSSNRCPPPSAPPISTASGFHSSNRAENSNRCPPPAPPISTVSGLLYLSSSGRLEEIEDSNRCPPLAPPLSVSSSSEEAGGNGGGVFCDPSQDAIIAHFDNVSPHLPLLTDSQTRTHDFDSH